MSVPAAKRAPRPREAARKARPKRPRIVYRVESEPGKDEQRGDEIMIGWLASLLTE